MELRQQRNLGYKRKKGIGVRRSGAGEADSSRAPFIPRKLLAHIQIKSTPVPARSVASLRSSPLSVGLRCVADAPSLRAQFHFFTIPKAAPLRGLPWAIVLSPRVAGLKIPLYRSAPIEHQAKHKQRGRFFKKMRKKFILGLPGVKKCAKFPPHCQR